MSNPKMIFVNLPVADLDRAEAFYTAIGATRDDRFCGPTGRCMALSDTIYVMILTPDFFRTFTTKDIADTGKAIEGLFCLSADSRDQVDAIVAAGESAGGKGDPGPKQDYGMMYGRSVEDPDGHHWEVMWMDVEAFLAAQAGQSGEPVTA